MSIDTVNIRCPNCQKINRTIVDQVLQVPICGNRDCRHPLPPLPPVPPSWYSWWGMVKYVCSRLEIPDFQAYRQRLQRYDSAVQCYTQHRLTWQADRAREEREAQGRIQQQQCEAIARIRWKQMHENICFENIDSMDGYEFEQFLALLFTHMGYHAVVTPKAGDQGADLILHDKHGLKMAVQAKRYTGKVGNEAIQQLLGGMTYYGCSSGILVTTASLTQSAIDLVVKASCISVIDRTMLRQLFIEKVGSRIPEFTWEAYNQLMVNTATQRYREYKQGKRRRRRRRF